MICRALATKKSMRVCETSELRMTNASISVKGYGCAPMWERSRVVSCSVLWNIMIILAMSSNIIHIDIKIYYSLYYQSNHPHIIRIDNISPFRVDNYNGSTRETRVRLIKVLR